MSQICRTCTQIIDEYFCVEGSIFASASLKVTDVLRVCIPELDLNLVPDSVICKNCMFSLYIMHQFKTETIRNEGAFRSKQHVRIKNLSSLTKNENLKNYGDFKYNELETIEVELDDVKDLNTELVYDVVNDDSITEIMNENLQNSSTTNTPLENTNDVLHDEYNESSSVFDCPPLVPISDNKFSDLQVQNKVNVLKEKCNIDVKKFIQCTSTNKKKRNIKRPYKCTECNFRSDARASLLMHSRIHTGEKPFHCPKCPYKAKRKAHLEDHLKIHTGERPFICEVCSKCFITKQILKKHMLIHTEEKPYRCLQCNFRSRHKLSITNHVKKVHIGIEKVSINEPRMCYVCGKWLSGLSSLNTHMKIHTGVKKHLCELCGKYFREKGMLKNHLRIHTGEKPFKCAQCDYIATRKAHLQEHMRTHVPDRELTQCSFCNKRYTTKLLLKKHMNEEHQELDDKDEQLEFI
ncbi:hypothetical protein ILUMI_11520 [Ignelater luminosus]|uniref:C2H2-type domain-containing protein n=1 Tax=Ignelater luminosus TaxID=2038154 RepID=A0A8K0GCM8_IGNLU|nr:hypothetical protein ILUMI_11520 [Ignelater luminosus]